MNKRTKILLNENNKYENSNLSDQCKAVMTDIVCYLRGSNISEYNQEVVRRDINYMLVDGERRGETPESIIGGDYQLFCDEIIKSFPEKTKKEKLISEVNETCTAIGIIVFIWLMGKISRGIINNTSIAQLNITLGEIIVNVYLVIAAKFIYKYITRSVFVKSNQSDNKLKNFLFLWMKLAVLIIIPVLLYIFLKTPSFTINLPIAVAIVIIPCLIGYTLDRVDI